LRLAVVILPRVLSGPNVLKAILEERRKITERNSAQSPPSTPARITGTKGWEIIIETEV
jgi:hypothetical protein